uniref:ANK_REP_REGION domain-containing protein n=2 Tax=Caenorhabditis tropicalis TaxID=1561998 RepID=A0A1I7T9P5_9PELO
MYWGEYPLSFAACTNQVDCFRLLRAMKADPNMPDTNGNTVLHLTVIHDLPEMFMLAVELGANLHVRNNLKLTPLALAARLAKKQIYDLILECDMDISWRYGPVVCKAYPLNDVDTINESDGSLNPNSVIANVVYGDKVEHLEFFDGLIEEVLESKWQTFGKKQLFMSLAGYIYFLAVFYLAFMTRDAHVLPKDNEEEIIEADYTNYTEILSAGLSLREHLAIARLAEREVLPAHCHLWDYSGPSQQIRMISEILCLFAVVVRTFKDCIDAHRTGFSRWWNSIKAFPEKVLHKFCQILVICTVPLRLGCYLDDSFLVIENFMVVCIVIMSTLHFLFYCRSLKFVGPFVLMVYKIIVRDMLRFLLIYSFFLMGFAQAFFVIFKSCERAEIVYQEKHNYTEDDEYIEKFENIMGDGWEAVMRMFIMSVGEFGALYKNLNECKSSIAPQSKVFFILFELIVTVMLLNLLIAMMTRTYEKIAETEKEWKRQRQRGFCHYIVILDRFVLIKDEELSLSRLNQIMLSRNIVAVRGAHKAAASSTKPVEKVTKLGNGLTVATIESNKPLTQLVLAFRAGSRYEKPAQIGLSHTLRNFVGRDSKDHFGSAIVWSASNYGGVVKSFSSRDLFGVSVTVPRDSTSYALHVLAQAAGNPGFKPWEVEDVYPTMRADNGFRTPFDLVVDQIHKAAYRNGGLGNSVYAPCSKIGLICHKTLTEFAVSISKNIKNYNFVV